MRDFFIGVLDKLITVFVVLMGIAIVIAAVAALVSPGTMGPGGGGILGFLFILIGGGLYVSFTAGFLYLGLGIYQNTRRTAEATERMAGQPRV
ncbi:hypothetical protein SAMN04488003_103141 [Loktanella fryxellensis]|uniref:Uncharacterized protein n=1 Tax=Loktanella fryxellensis TaxID=245187 RepID=A0A1H8AI79_9RHOB|nr:hypothetical protein [Loktanella fryxellensis]SEM69227.1 hypothetical protein SAMN04488003_103141 [Loktanella fryxellensis]